ncbi:MAG: hypothetical protein OEQ18_11260, partial [Gammaproteobacteria bacterium]|nr:hypothetical protein [Gammaproteobacteria bacterium]
NRELIDIHRLTPEHMEAHLNYLRNLITAFVAETGSAWGREILENFVDLVRHFWLVKPKASDLETLLSTLLRAA